MDDRIHNWEDLPIDADLKNEKKVWSYGRGGHGLDDGQWHIYKIDEKDWSADIYVLPKSVCQLLDWQYDIGKSDARRDMRIALGLGV